jgi:D-alanyl-D-alanine carboxypeptidase
VLNFRLSVAALMGLCLAACQSRAAATSAPTVIPSPTASASPSATVTAHPSPTPLPTATVIQLPTPSTPLVACDQRRPAADDLLHVVTAGFGLSPDYVPPDLVKLGGYLSYRIVNPDFLFRRVAVDALVGLIQAMQADGLHPQILSTYRGYYDQIVVRDNWEQQDPNQADLVSAAPGHSEHQLGTVADFGSPELAGLVGDPAVRFHPLFAQTGEGRWLSEHAYQYGFTLTNPPEARVWTGLLYEPWHYRYVGVDLATYLQASRTFLTKFLFQVRQAPPCIPSLVTP